MKRGADHTEGDRQLALPGGIGSSKARDRLALIVRRSSFQYFAARRSDDELGI
jgi:hypothetical protein